MIFLNNKDLQYETVKSGIRGTIYWPICRYEANRKDKSPTSISAYAL